MVAKISLPVDDSVDIIERTIDEKVQYRGFYDRIKNDLVEHAKLYINTNGNPAAFTPLNLRDYTDTDEEAEGRKISLIGLYTPPKHKLPYTQLETIRKDHGLVVCPSCGELGRPRTLDHYLPKDIFPEFSILLLNLTPMCDWCQGEKSTEYITPEGRQKYIHPYYDDVNRPLCSIIFSPPYASPIIHIEVCKDLPLELSQLVISHLDGINFISRFKEFFKTRYIHILRKAQNNQENWRLIINYFLDMENEKSINSWDAILYRSIIEDDELMSFLENDPLPDNL